ncbi:YfbM family protein [Amycolatopsis taiwanensis]|uniref:DUF1877 domain-containing protein n=1 Tax=Amycolatopsis taiwanensis TaxID=342230 RepID=A0A9W6VIQ1_9PSEU|nr:YfbM family protein [Amycolatopsis taiwanensis]GLY67701.1 hypothetical protein Atai01_43200 [Amycolatopsis taiwanensis]
MGMVLGWEMVTPAELERAFADPEWAWEFVDEVCDRPGQPDGFIEKAWGGIQFLLDAEGLGLDLLTDGTPIDEENLLTGWSAETVKQVAEELRKVPFAMLARHYDPAKMMSEGVYPRMWDHDSDGELEYVKSNYETLVNFFVRTAAADCAAIMEFNI